MPEAVGQSVSRLVAATKETGRVCNALVSIMVIADETDAAAMAKWEHYKDGIDLEAIAWREAQAEDDPTRDPFAGPNKRKTFGTQRLPSVGGVLVGSYASIARMLDQLGSIPGVDGVMLSFDEFVTGIDNFGRYVLPLMTCREAMVGAC